MLTVESVTHGITASPLQLRAAFRQLGYATSPEAETQLTLNECFCFWVIMLIHRFKYLTYEQRELLTDEILFAIRKIGNVDPSTLEAVPMVVIADSRYAVWYGRTGWLDLNTGENALTPGKRKPLETLAYDLGELFSRNYAACVKRAKPRVPSNEQSPQPDSECVP